MKPEIEFLHLLIDAKPDFASRIASFALEYPQGLDVETPKIFPGWIKEGETFENINGAIELLKKGCQF